MAISDRPLKIEAVEAFLLFSFMVVTEGNERIARNEAIQYYFHRFLLCRGWEKITTNVVCRLLEMRIQHSILPLSFGVGLIDHNIRVNFI